MGSDSRAAGPERMPDGDGAAVHVGALSIQAELTLYRNVLRGERLVHFDQIHAVQLQSGTGERSPGRRRGADAHDRRIDSGDGPAHQPPEGWEPAVAGPPLARDDEGPRAIGNAGRISRGHEAVLPEDG